MRAALCEREIYTVISVDWPVTGIATYYDFKENLEPFDPKHHHQFNPARARYCSHSEYWRSIARN